MEKVAIKKDNMNIEAYRKLLTPYLEELQQDEIINHKKIVELCHVGKLLMNLDSTSYIENFGESPDFLIDFGGEKIGIEHRIIIDNKEKSYEGFFENVFRHAKIELKKDKSIPNFLANCWLYDNIEYKQKQKNLYIKLVTDLIKEYILTNKLRKNDLIERIYTMPHSGIDLCPNFGAWFQKYLSTEILQKAINEKEKKLSEYKETIKDVWLLLVVGGTNASSYELYQNMQYNIQSNFDKVFLLEDHKNQLYQLK